MKTASGQTVGKPMAEAMKERLMHALQGVAQMNYENCEAFSLEESYFCGWMQCWGMVVAMADDELTKRDLLRQIRELRFPASVVDRLAAMLGGK